MPARVIATVHGRVQRAGFRDFVQEQADRLDLTGSVENLADRTVRIEAEGEPKVLEQFLAAVRQAPFPIKVTRLETTKIAATGEFRDFAILRGADEGLGERLDAGAFYLREMNRNLGSKIDASSETLGSKIDAVGKGVRSVGTQVQSVSTEVRSVGKKIDRLTLQTARHFTQLDRNYGAISKTLAAALRELQAGRSESAAALRELRDEHRASRADMQKLIKVVVAASKRK